MINYDEKKYYCSGCGDHISIKEISMNGPATMNWCNKEECREKALQASKHWDLFALYILMNCRSELPSSSMVKEEINKNEP